MSTYLTTLCPNSFVPNAGPMPGAPKGLLLRHLSNKNFNKNAIFWNSCYFSGDSSKGKALTQLFMGCCIFMAEDIRIHRFLGCKVSYEESPNMLNISLWVCYIFNLQSVIPRAFALGIAEWGSDVERRLLNACKMFKKFYSSKNREKC